jgi:hypothetical protein
MVHEIPVGGSCCWFSAREPPGQTGKGGPAVQQCAKGGLVQDDDATQSREDFTAMVPDSELACPVAARVLPNPANAWHQRHAKLDRLLMQPAITTPV